jgi:hypothetical protein
VLGDIDNRELRREISLERRMELLSLLGLGVLIFSFLLLLAWQHFTFVRDAYRLAGLRADLAVRVEQNHALRLEQAALADPSRIEFLSKQLPEPKFAQPQLTWPIHNPPTLTRSIR